MAGLLATSTLALAASAGQRDHPHFLPKHLNGVPELSTVVLNPATKTFLQVQFDRGRITAVQTASTSGGAASNAGTITIVQRQGGVVWRTQSFAVPASAEVFAGGQKKRLANLRVGMHARIEQSAISGGALEVVRVDAGKTAAASLFPTSGGSAGG